MDQDNDPIHSAQPRIREIDALRGVAVIAMVIYHAAFDLDFFGVTDIDLATFPWNALARIAQVLFIFLGGVTFAFSFQKDRNQSVQHAVKQRVRHALTLFLFAMGISAVTYFLFPGQGVKFGILHFFSVAILLSTAFVPLGKWNALLGMTIIAVGTLVPLPTDPWWFFPIGIHSASFYSLDYFPLLPWYGLFLVGMGLSYALLPSGHARRYRPSLPFPSLETIGRHSLAIYLIHQPVLVGVILLFRQ